MCSASRFMVFAGVFGAAIVLCLAMAAAPQAARGQAGSNATPAFTPTPPAAPTPPPLDQTAAVSSGSEVQPGSSVTFVAAPLDSAAPPSGPARLRVENHGDQQASVFYDGLTLELS